MIRDKHILVAVLNWGLGHATRSVPIIKKLIDNNNRIQIASDGDALVLLKSEFPSQEFIELPPYSIRYPSKNMFWNMMIYLPKLAGAVYNENKLISSVITKHQYDIIISDNRYGCYDSRCHNVFITHQLNIQAGLFTNLINRIQARILGKFHEIWIPDFKSRLLSGDLSDTKWIKDKEIKYIGPQSRLSKSIDHSSIFDITAVLSGPEPQRSIIERKIYSDLSRLPYNSLLIRGLRRPSYELESSNGIKVVNYAGAEDLSNFLSQSQFIIMRSGYSSIMDLNHIGGKALLIPTPGQTEQLYLAKQLALRGISEVQNQEDIDIERAWSQKDLFSGFPLT